MIRPIINLFIGLIKYCLKFEILPEKILTYLMLVNKMLKLIRNKYLITDNIRKI